MDIVWLRDDFRLDDQPALAAAADGTALVVYVHDRRPENGRPPGGAAKWRLAQSLTAMARSLAARGGRLDVVEGEADRVILDLAAAAGARRVLWTRRYEAASVALDAAVKAALKARGVEALSFNGRLMREPWDAGEGRRQAGRRVFRLLAPASRARPLPAPLAAPTRLAAAPWPADGPGSDDHRGAAADPDEPDWSGELSLGEAPGEDGAHGRARRFVADALPAYADQRDRLAPDATSRLSAALRFGELSSRRAAATVEAAAEATRVSPARRTNSSRNSAGAISPTPCCSPIPISPRVR